MAAVMAAVWNWPHATATTGSLEVLAEFSPVLRREKESTNVGLDTKTLPRNWLLAIPSWPYLAHPQVYRVP